MFWGGFSPLLGGAAALSDVLLVVSNAAHAQGTDEGSLALTQASTLAVSNASHAQAAQSLTLALEYTLSVANAEHGHFTPWNPEVWLIPGVGLVTVAETALLPGGLVAEPQLEVTYEAGATLLVVADASHASADDGPLGLAQQNTISVSSAAQAQAAETVGLVQASVIAVGNAAHSHSAISTLGEPQLTLTQQSTLSASNAVHAQAVEGPIALTQANVLAVAAASHVQRFDESTTLVQASTIAVLGAGHIQTAESPTLVQANTLAASDAAHAQAAGSIVLEATSTHVDLTLQDALHQQYSPENPAVTDVLLPDIGLVSLESSSLLPGGLWTPAASTLELGLPEELVVSAASHAQTSQSPTLTYTALLVVADASHAQAAEAPDFSTTLEEWVLVPAVGLVPLTPGLLVPGALVAGEGQTVGQLQVAGDFVGQTSSTIALEPAYVAGIAWVQLDVAADAVVVADAWHGNVTSDTVVLVQAHTLAVADATHTPKDEWSLAMANAAHAHSAESVALTVGLGVANAAHLHTASGGDTLKLVKVLAVANAAHAPSSSTVTLNATYTLAPLEALHGQSATGPLELLATYVLTIPDTRHAQAATGNILLDQSALLEPADAAHTQAAESPTLGVGLQILSAWHALESTGAVTVDLVLSNAYHSQYTLPITFALDQWELDGLDASHAQEAEAVSLTQANVLGGLDATHFQSVDSIWETGASWTKDTGRWHSWSRRASGAGSWTPVGGAGNGWTKVNRL